MRVEIRRLLPCLTSARDLYIRQLKFFDALCKHMSSIDHKMTVNIDFGVTNKC